MHAWEVMSGRWGTKYSGPDGKKAKRIYRRMVQEALRSKSAVTVTLYRDGVSFREFDGELAQSAVTVS